MNYHIIVYIEGEYKMFDKKLVEETVELLVSESEGLRGTLCCGVALITSSLEHKGFKREDLRNIGMSFITEIKGLESFEDKEKYLFEIPKKVISHEKAIEIVGALVNESESYSGTLTTGLSILALALEQKGYDHYAVEQAVNNFILNVTKVSTPEQDMKVIEDMLK